jgi:Domain of unknown function (DUF4399)/Family of unknown function (DUF6130)
MDGAWRGRLAAAVAALLAVGATACGGGPSKKTQSATTATTPSASTVALQIKSPAPGTEVKGNVVVLDLAVEGVTIQPANGDTSGKTGHLHVFIDRAPVPVGQVIPKEPGVIHTTDNPVTVAGLTPGKHKLAVAIGDGAHRSMSHTPAEVEVTVLGPAVEATAPASAPAGQPVTIQLKATGVTIVGANGDTSGKTGHFHLFVDRLPVAPGALIPTGDPDIIHTTETSVQLKDLAAGDHVVWVVIGDGVHRALDPPVRAKVMFSVTG